MTNRDSAAIGKGGKATTGKLSGGPRRGGAKSAGKVAAGSDADTSAIGALVGSPDDRRT